MKPICVPCQRFFRPTRNGVSFIEGMPIGNDVKPGLAEPENWKPYKLWRGDLWACRGCGHTIVVGVAGGPISEHYQPDFDTLVKAYGGDQLQVNDC